MDKYRSHRLFSSRALWDQLLTAISGTPENKPFFVEGVKRRPVNPWVDSRGDHGKTSFGAWVRGEAVFFTPKALKFECRYHSNWEGFEKSCTNSPARQRDIGLAQV